MLAALASLAACVPLGRSVTTPQAIAAADSVVKAAMGREAAIDPRTFPETTVGVTPFRVTSADTTLLVLGYGLADLLITDLSRASRLRVVDRLRVDALMRELSLVASGRVDSASAPRAGRLLGARRLVLGSLTTDARGPARLDGRVGDVVTGRVSATPTSRAPIDAILDAEKSLAFSLFQTLGVTLTPGERNLVEQRPTKSLAALLAYSRGVRDEELKDLRKARGEYQAALRLDPAFPAAQQRLDLMDRWIAEIGRPGEPATDGSRLTNPVGPLVVEGVNRSVAPEVFGATEPAFRQRLAATLILILQLP
jgi:TolB-like protein